MKFSGDTLAVVLGIFFFAYSCAYAIDEVVSADAGEVTCASSVDAIPQDAYLLPVERAGDLQDELDRRGTVRLEAFGDYTKKGGPSSITLMSGQKLYGLMGSRIGRVVVKGGAVGVVLQGVLTDGLEFLPADSATRNNCFRRISGKITIKNAKLENNLFVDLSRSPLDIDTRSRGYLRNNKFIRTQVHGSSPALRMRGDAGHLSGNNVFIWFNVLTPHGDGIIVDQQDDVSFIGLDAESWNWSKRAKNPAMMTVRSTGSLRVVAGNGGDPKSRAGRYFDIGAEEVMLIGSRIGPVGMPAIILQPETRRMATINLQKLGETHRVGDFFRFSAFDDGKSSVFVNGRDVRKASLSADEIATFRQMFVAEKQAGQSVGGAVLPPIPDPAGPGWDAGLQNKKDSADYIQNLIDTKGVAYLPEGIFYVSKSLRLNAGQGIVGAGASRTAIIAKNRNIDIIVADQHVTEPSPTSFMLVDLTLQGGRNGLVHNASGAGAGAQFNLVFLSHVTFRDMLETGILIDGIYAWDNNFIDNVNFYRCAQAGIKQRVGRFWVPGTRPGMTYMDKNVFYRCQFVESGRGVDLEAKRANNLNAFVECSFRDNSELAVRQTHSSSTIFVDSHFINNNGNPVIESDQPTFFINSYFRADRHGVVLLPGDATCESCVFEMGKSDKAEIISDEERVFLFNSKSIDVPLGDVGSGLLVNSAFPGDSMLSEQAVSVDDGVPQVVVGGAARPTPQLLPSSAYSK